MDHLLKKIRSCEHCKKFLPGKPRPVLQAAINSRVLIIDQAPGKKVDQSGVPWDDASGNELRRWLGVTTEQFYDPAIFALVPMGFCYPGKGASGDNPPRPECAPLWHELLLNEMKQVKLTILIGQYAQKYYLAEKFNSSITENVMRYKKFLPQYLPLVHPSPRNRIWQKKNPWFETDLLPVVQKLVKKIL